MTALYETELSPQTFYGTERNGTDTFFARGHITAGNNNPWILQVSFKSTEFYTNDQNVYKAVLKKKLSVRKNKPKTRSNGTIVFYTNKNGLIDN